MFKKIILLGLYIMVFAGYSYACGGGACSETSGGSCGGGCSCGGMKHSSQASIKDSSQAHLVEISNKICPVDKIEIGSMGPGVKVTYNEKVYNLCCAGCIETFQNDPKKYSELVRKS